MKKILFFSFVIAAFAMASCDEVKDAVDDFQKDQAPSYVESKDGLKITVSYAKDGISAQAEAKFKVDKSEEHLLSDTVCTSFITKNSYALEAVAKQAYESVKRESGDDIDISYSNKTITIEYKEYIGVEKPLVEVMLKSMYESYEMVYSGKYNLE